MWNAVVDMFLDEWDLGRSLSQTSGRTCGWVYLFEILSQSDEIIAHYDNGRVCGIAGYGNFRKPRKKFRKSLYRLRRNLLIKMKIRNKDGLKKYYETYNYFPKELENYFDGDLSILIVDKQHRSKGIGKLLFDEICNRAAKSGIRKLRIDTDDSCNKHFYEANGCKLVYETKCQYGYGERQTENGYIFEKLLGGEV